jgi:hydroxylaminobenzene mutase
MEALGRTLCKSGLWLFVVGLALGFVLQTFPNPRAALSAHLNAVQSGTFLVALGLMWPQLTLKPNIRKPLAHITWVAFSVLELGMVFAAFVPAGEDAAGAASALKTGATALQASSAVAMFIAVGALLFAFQRQAPRNATERRSTPLAADAARPSGGE